MFDSNVHDGWKRSSRIAENDSAGTEPDSGGRGVSWSRQGFEKPLSGEARFESEGLDKSKDVVT